MNPTTLLELQRELQRIQAADTRPRPFARRFRYALGTLCLAVALTAFWFAYESDTSRFAILLYSILIASLSLYTVIQNNIDKRLRPILEGLLYVPETMPKQEQSDEVANAKPKRVRPKRR